MIVDVDCERCRGEGWLLQRIPSLGKGLYRSNLSSSVEVQANQMAADILMPWHLIRDAEERGLNTVEELAKHFNVSMSTMSIQLGVPYESA